LEKTTNSPPSIIGMVKSRRMRWAGHGEKRNAYKILVRKPEGKCPLGRPRHRWENIKKDLRETGWGAMGWIRIETGGRLL
jgi:hypothetical protein